MILCSTREREREKRKKDRQRERESKQERQRKEEKSKTAKKKTYWSYSIESISSCRENNITKVDHLTKGGEKEDEHKSTVRRVS